MNATSLPQSVCLTDCNEYKFRFTCVVMTVITWTCVMINSHYLFIRGDIWYMLVFIEIVHAGLHITVCLFTLHLFCVYSVDMKFILCFSHWPTHLLMFAQVLHVCFDMHMFVRVCMMFVFVVADNVIRCCRLHRATPFVSKVGNLYGSDYSTLSILAFCRNQSIVHFVTSWSRSRCLCHWQCLTWSTELIQIHRHNVFDS